MPCLSHVMLRHRQGTSAEHGSQPPRLTTQQSFFAQSGPACLCGQSRSPWQKDPEVLKCLSPSKKVQSSGGSSLADVPGSSMEKMDPKSCAVQQQLQSQDRPVQPCEGQG